MIRTRPMTLLGLLAALALVLAACGNGGGAETPEPDDDGEAAQTQPAATDDEDGGDGDGDMTASVTIVDFGFGDDLTVEAGTTITFVNEDSAAHTVTEGEGGEAAADARFDEEVTGGGEIELTFDEPGEYPITCRFHPEMQMTITVEG